MIVVCHRIEANPEDGTPPEGRIARCIAHRAPGFRSFRLLRPEEPGESYIVMTLWESHADFQAWLNSEKARQPYEAADLPLGEIFHIIAPPPEAA